MNLMGNDRKPFPEISGTCRFNRRIERQKISLIRNIFNKINNLAD